MSSAPCTSAWNLLAVRTAHALCWCRRGGSVAVNLVDCEVDHVTSIEIAGLTVCFPQNFPSLNHFLGIVVLDLDRFGHSSFAHSETFPVLEYCPAFALLWRG